MGGAAPGTGQTDKSSRRDQTTISILKDDFEPDNLPLIVPDFYIKKTHK